MRLFESSIFLIGSIHWVQLCEAKNCAANGSRNSHCHSVVGVSALHSSNFLDLHGCACGGRRVTSLESIFMQKALEGDLRSCSPIPNR
jgi:hypothetical protein